MISGVLFDLDGTLIDCVRPMEVAFVDAVEMLGSKITDEGRKNVSKNLHEILIKRSSPYAGAVFLWRIGRFVGLSPFKRLLLMIYAFRRLKEIANNSPLFPGVAPLLSELSNMRLKMGIVTTRNDNEAAFVLRKNSIDQYFSTVITRDDAHRGKPHPDPVLLAMKLLNLKPEETVMVGDMPTDIEAGRSAGTKTIGLLLGIFNKELIGIKPDALASSIQELPQIIKRL